MIALLTTTNMGDVTRGCIKIPLTVSGVTAVRLPPLPIELPDWSLNYTIRICLGGFLCNSVNVVLFGENTTKNVTIWVLPSGVQL